MAAIKKGQTLYYVKSCLSVEQIEIASCVVEKVKRGSHFEVSVHWEKKFNFSSFEEKGFWYEFSKEKQRIKLYESEQDAIHSTKRRLMEESILKIASNKTVISIFDFTDLEAAYKIIQKYANHLD